MSKEKTIEAGVYTVEKRGWNDNALSHVLKVELGKAYNEGFVAGSGQSSITALEREVIVAALEWAREPTYVFRNEKLMLAIEELQAAIEKAEGE
jgi:hypothetical protein